jgi:triacylglycerol lipase
MTPLGLVETTGQPAQPSTPLVPALSVRFEDVLASARRLWVRGRLGGLPRSAPAKSKESHWWGRWRRAPKPAVPPLVHLETRISGQTFTADVPLQPGDRFEALFAGDLPTARRGWRIARNRISCAGLTGEQCAVVLGSGAETRSAVVVILPLVFTQEQHGAQRLARSKSAVALAPILRGLQHSGGAWTYYYLGCVPPGLENRQGELALATTTLGWPTGEFVLLPADSLAAPAALVEGIDRLRWLFAGAAELIVVNQEPAATGPLASSVVAKADRADVRRLLHPEEDPRTVLQPTANEDPRSTGNGFHPARSNLVPRYPVVFCHGMLAMSTLRMCVPEDLNCFAPLRRFLEERGYRAFFPQVSPTGGVVARAAQLREQIERWTDGPINLIAHSMGGLDARHAITHEGLADRVRSLTTVSTPHRGTFLADWFITHFRHRVPLLFAMEAMGVNVDGFRDCRPDVCRAFNATTPDMPGIKYLSYGAAVTGSQVSPALRRAWTMLSAVEGPNDGMVSVASARWGEYLGTLNADHYAQTPDLTFVRPGEDFDSLSFYLGLLTNLARRGF